MKKFTSFPAFLSLIGLALTGLTGCASLNSSFDCPMKPGVMCESLDKVNSQVDSGTLGGTSAVTCSTCNKAKPTLATLTGASGFTTLYPLPAFNPGDPVRYGETILRVWLAPFEDKDGNYYQPDLIYTVVKPGHWLGHPVKAVTGEGDDA